MKNDNHNPAPEKFKGKGPLDAFLNLLSLITLSWLWIVTIQVAHQIIDKYLSKPTIDMYLSGGYSQTGLKFGIASMIIIAPVFFVVINVLHKQYKENKLNHSSGIYRWLTYLMILASSLTILGGLIALIYNFLNGAYTVAILSKILVVLISAIIVFGFYFFDLRRHNYSKRNKLSIIFFAVTLVLIIGILIGGLFVVDSPKVTKMKQFDQQRANDLSNLNSYLVMQYATSAKLPENFKDVNIKANDPETKQPYEYIKTGPKTYELCATFSLSVETDSNSGEFRPVQIEDWYNHGAGRQCFKRDLTGVINTSGLKDFNAAPAIQNALPENSNKFSN